MTEELWLIKLARALTYINGIYIFLICPVLLTQSALISLYKGAVMCPEYMKNQLEYAQLSIIHVDSCFLMKAL